MSIQKICLIIAFVLFLLAAIGFDKVSLGTVTLHTAYFGLAALTVAFWPKG